jgi:hypothetical protein
MYELKYKIILLVCFSVSINNLIYAQGGYDLKDIEESPRGQAEIAEKYLQWAQTALREGREAEAANALHRALDYADVSSDISYLLAVVENDMPFISRSEVLFYIDLALETERWKYYSINGAHILKANLLFELMRYEEALRVIPLINESAEKELLCLKVLLQLKQNILFERTAERAMNLYPYNTEIASLVLKYAHSLDYREGGGDGLLALVLKRLSVLGEIDGNLYWQAAPFMLDIEEAARQLQAWSASSGAEHGEVAKAALPVLLNLGVIDEESAAEALFTLPYNEGNVIIDIDTLMAVFNLLRTRPSRELFISMLSNYTGVICEDTNKDGIYESFCYYRSGLPVYFTNDAKQEKINNMSVEWKAGDIQRAIITVLKEDAEILTAINIPFFMRPDSMIVDYERYPAVMKIELYKNIYYFRPKDFYYTMILFEKIIPDSEIIFPKINDESSTITLNTLFSFAFLVERPSEETLGAMEHLKLLNGVIVSSREILDGKIISETEFTAGRPLRQNIDLDLDGRMETRRYFRINEAGESEMDYAQSDWDDNGIYE